MILTVSLNPAVDRTSVLEELIPGTVMRTRSTVTRAGGKGINVARAVCAARGEALALYLATQVRSSPPCSRRRAFPPAQSPV